MTTIAQNLADLGITLPKPAAPIANYLPYILTDRLLILSGQLPMGPAGIDPAHRGKLGGEVSNENGIAAARLCAINILAQAQLALGSLERIGRCVQLRGFINCLPNFDSVPQIVNGASDLMVQVLGEAGKHARSSIGIAQLPLDAAVEIEAIFEVKP
ncbi:MAG: RidA family protein [Hyphomicrobiales bacterium]|nr:RidA family protein [Hyphomicrobiales bacterium]MDE2114889.1 RidA family protein [Hyphomicrobiales bacterium]